MLQVVAHVSHPRSSGRADAMRYELQAGRTALLAVRLERGLGKVVRLTPLSQTRLIFVTVCQARVSDQGCSGTIRSPLASIRSAQSMAARRNFGSRSCTGERALMPEQADGFSSVLYLANSIAGQAVKAAFAPSPPPSPSAPARQTRSFATTLSRACNASEPNPSAPSILTLEHIDELARYKRL